MIDKMLVRARELIVRRLLGVSAEELRYTFEDVRRELRSTRTELSAEIAELRREIDRLERRTAAEDRVGREEPIAEA